MTVSARDALLMASEHLTETVIYPSLRSGLSAPARLLGNCCSSYYFEYHCSNPLQCDLLCSLTRTKSHALRKKFATRSRSSDDGRWNVAHSFLVNWNRADTTLADRIPHIWIAFDFNGTTGAFDPPNLHFCIDNNFQERSVQPEYRNILSPQQLQSTFTDIINNCFSTGPTPETPSLKRCFRALDTGGEVLHLSFMHSRVPPVFKLNTTIPAHAVDRTLSDAGWKGNRSLVRKLCGEFAAGEDRIKCNICFTRGISRQFEIELEYNSPLLSDRRRSKMITSLRRNNLISPEQARIFRKWPGSTAITPSRGTSTVDLQRWLDVKLTINTSGNVAAKAYFGFAAVPAITW